MLQRAGALARPVIIVGMFNELSGTMGNAPPSAQRLEYKS